MDEPNETSNPMIVGHLLIKSEGEILVNQRDVKVEPLAPSEKKNECEQ